MFRVIMQLSDRSDCLKDLTSCWESFHRMKRQSRYSELRFKILF